jgi:hypothetical protein
MISPLVKDTNLLVSEAFRDIKAMLKMPFFHGNNNRCLMEHLGHKKQINLW